MWFLRFNALAAVLAVTGCTTLPPLVENHSVVVRDVIDRVQCEFQHAQTELAKSRVDLKNWFGEFTLTLAVEQKSGLGGGVDVLQVVTNGSWTPGASFGVNTIANRSVKLTFEVDLTGKTPRRCDRTIAPENTEGPGLLGKLGLLDGLTRTLTQIDKDDLLKAKGIGHFTEFTINIVGEGHLAFAFNVPSGKAGLNAGYTTIHTLNAAFAPLPEPKRATAHKGVGPSRAVPVSRALPRDEAASEPRATVRRIIQEQTLQNLRIQR